MAVAPGTRLGPYEVSALLGAGGMGEVYRARDSRLARDVALKFLPQSFTHDTERLARFRREAHVLAALNHPHIGSIYGLEELNGHHFLVLELVEGETLAARLQKGPLPLDEATAIAREVAEALEAAHEKGIVHRDLKPANIALTPHDRVKVLDFGLAKPGDALPAPSAPDVVNSPTITSPTMLTGLGVILGTAAYMSPEQAKGRVADKRSDVWAFGCVLYEMLTGRRAFEGEDVSETLAAVLKAEPDWEALPRSVPRPIRQLLEGCLQKDSRQRVSDISTARFLLDLRPGAAVSEAPPPRRGPTGLKTLLGLVVLALGATIAVAVWKPAAVPAPTVARFSLPVPGSRELMLSRRAVSISPDGTRIVYAVDGQFFIRRLSELEARPIPGTELAILPTFSPDGQSILFWRDPGLKRVGLAGGVPLSICDTVPAPFGVSWTDQGIIFVEPGTGIMRVSQDGGTPTVLVRLTAAEGLAQGAHLLPDGDTLLFTLARRGNSSTFWQEGEIVAHSLRTGRRKTLVRNASDARYLDTGHLAYIVEGTMMAVPFDVETLEVTGGPVPVLEGVLRAAPAGGGEPHLAISHNGDLVFVPGPARMGSDVVIVYDRSGQVETLKLPPGSYAYPRVSPDGKWIALESTEGREAFVGVYDLSGASSFRRLTFGGNNRMPIWSADGRRVIFQSDREGDLGLFWQPVDGGPAERLTRPEQGTAHVPEAWSPRGDVFLFSVGKGSSFSLHTFSIGDRRATPFADVTSTAFPTDAVFSPDGRWVAYQAGDRGTGEATTYVQPFPPTGAKFQIARGGRPVWSRDGRELFLIPAPSRLTAVSVRTEPTFAFTSPVLVPRRFGLSPPANPRTFDLLPDGRIVGIGSAGQFDRAGSPDIHVVLNWFEELRTRVPRP